MQKENIWNFETNQEGGWIVPAGTKFEEPVQFPDWSEFGSNSRFGSGSEFGYGSRFGSGSEFGSYSRFGSDSEFGSYSEFGYNSIFGSYSEFGSNSRFGSGSIFNYNSEFGSYSEFGSNSIFGSGSVFGSDCTIEGVKLIKMFQLQNLDGSGRMINIIKHEDGILIRAGCFLGTADEFCTKAESEGKLDCARVLRAIIENY